MYMEDNMSWFAWVALTECYRIGNLKGTLFFFSSELWRLEVQNQSAAWLASGEGSLPDLQFSSCVLTRGGDREV